jgi:hypothetical protein
VRNPFDQVAKKVGKGALDASGVTLIQHEISRDAQHADLLHEPDPTRDAERARLGLLGRMVATLCLIEVFGHTPDGREFRACLAKHFSYWEERERKTRAQNKRHKEQHQPPETLRAPFLWIIAATASSTMLRTLKLEPASGWPPGVYLFGEDLLRVGLVVASELPRDRSTLLVRIMAGGPVLPRAIADLVALPEDAYERTVAEDVLVQLNHVLGTKPIRSPEEEEFIVTMQSTWKQARKEGRHEEAVRAVLTALRVRGIVVPDTTRERIFAETDLDQLQRWLEKAIVAGSLEEVIGTSD